MADSPPAGALPRLLVLASTYPRWPGDPEPGFVHDLCRRLTSHFQVLVLTPSAPATAKREIMDGVEVHRYRYAPRGLETLVHEGGILSNLKCSRWKLALVPGFVLGLVFGLWRIERRWRPDVIHAHWLLPQGLVAAFRSKRRRRVVPFVVTSHGADLYALRAGFFRKLKQLIARRAAAITVVSGAMAQQIAALRPGSTPVSVQPMGVDFAGRFHPDAAVARDGDELLFVGRFVEKKGLRELIDAMPMVLQTCPAAHLTVVGFGPEDADRRAQVRALDLTERIRFAGAVPQTDLPSFYRRATVLVVPFVEAASGDQEGLGLVMLEAAGCGCRVVAGALPAVKDVSDGALVRDVPVGSAELLASAVAAALHDRNLERAESARQQLVARFDWSVVVGEYAALLQRTIASGVK